MKTLLTVLAVSLLATACGSSATTLTATPQWHMQSGNEGDVAGSTGSLEVTDDKASVRYEANDLNAGHAYTMWWVVINEPAECANHPAPCEPPDVLGNAETDSQILYAGGQVVEGTTAVFEAEIEAGDGANGWLEGRTLGDPTTAEYHLVLNDHGPAIDGLEGQMTGTYRGGCTDESLPEAFPPSAFADGEPGPNTCRLWQSVIFQT